LSSSKKLVHAALEGLEKLITYNYLDGNYLIQTDEN